MQASSFFIGPQKTPKPVKTLIWATVLTSLLSPIVTFALMHYFKLPGPQQWFSLTLWGLQKGWVWQPFTYLFVHSAGVGITFSLLLSLFFHMLLLWFAGSEVNTRFGTRSFLLFYFGGGVLAGLIATLFLFLFSSQTILYGSGPPIYALLMVWAMLYPDLELVFLFLIRIKAKWLVLGVLGLTLLINLSYGAFAPLLADLTGVLWGFAIGHWIWKLPNPYPLNLQKGAPKKKKRGKVIDINVFQEDDDAFMDRMLAKIAQRGESSLTKRERDRMRKISERRHQK